MRVISPCKPGTLRPFNVVVLLGRNAGSHPFVQRLSANLTFGLPHTRTNTTKSKYGDHAVKVSALEWRLKAGATGWSPSSRRILLGFHSFSTRTITPSHVSELTMSTTSSPTLF